MKFRLLIIISFFATNLTQNAESVSDGGKESKLYKSFDEIFGKGWDDESNDSKDLNCRHVKEEDQDVQAPITSDQKNIEAEILKQKFDEIYDENWSEDENNSAPDQDESVDEHQNESNECEKIQSDQQKREIIQKFCEMKENYRERNKRRHSNKEWNQIDVKIANCLGVSRYKLYKWMKELGLSRETKLKSTDQQKRQIIQKFREIKKNYRGKTGTHSAKEWVQIENKISNDLGVGRTTIYKWIIKLGLSRNKPKFSEFEKREILKQFDQIKSKCKQAKFNISMFEFDEKIAKKLGVSAPTIYGWKNEFGFAGISNKDKFSDATKIGILKKYAKIKENNPKMSQRDIADLLKISISSLNRWMKKTTIFKSTKL